MKSLLQSPTPNPEWSRDFYTKLKFSVVEHEHRTLYTDGKVLVEVNPSRYARAGIRLLAESWYDTVGSLAETVNITELEDGYLIADPSNVWVYLEETEEEIDFSPQDHSSSLAGNYAGLSFESPDFPRSVAFWTALGFSLSFGDAQSGFAGLTNKDEMTISLMKPNSCPHLFFNPSMTYFNSGKNPEIIEKIREAGIPITEEITHFNKEGLVDNIIIRDPGGFGFFIFND